MSRFFSRRLARLSPYVPGEQPQGREYIKLNTNESPFPPSPRVLEALGGGEAARLNLYPDPEARAAASAIAERHGLSPAHVMLTNGSDEALAFCFQAFCDGSAPAVFPDVTYGLYAVLARLYGVPSRIVPLLPDFSVDFAGIAGITGIAGIADIADIADIAETADTDGTDDIAGTAGTADTDGIAGIAGSCGGRAAVFLANPNAPTGIAAPAAAVERLISSNPGTVFIVDEAYVEFGAESVAPLICRCGNLAVVHTMSKSRNLAGARIGYVLADPELIADLNTVRYSFNPYSVSRLALTAAEAAIRDGAYYDACVTAIAQTRSHVSRELLRRGFDVLPSLANFVFARPGFIGGCEYYAALKERGVLVRHFAAPERISGFVRITIGTEGQMQALLDATDAIAAGTGGRPTGRANG